MLGISRANLQILYLAKPWLDGYSNVLSKTSSALQLGVQTFTARGRLLSEMRDLA